MSEGKRTKIITLGGPMDTGYPALISEPAHAPTEPKKVQQTCCTTVPEEKLAGEGNPDQPGTHTLPPPADNTYNKVSSVLK